MIDFSSEKYSGRPLPPEIYREELVDLYNAGRSLNEVSRTTLLYEQKNSRPPTEPLVYVCRPCSVS